MNRIKSFASAHRDLLTKFSKYVLTGGTAFIIEYSLFLLLKDVLYVHYIIANAIVYTTMFWFTFLVNKYFTFGARGKGGRQLIRYIALYLFNLCATNCLLFILTDWCALSPYIGKFLVSAIVVLWNFPIYRKFIYR